MSKKINRQLLQDILSKGDGVKTVSGEAVDWIISYAEEMAKRMAKDGRRSPSGRLMGFNMEPSVAVSVDYRNAELRVLGAESVKVITGPTENSTITEAKWSEYNDWQTAVKRGETKLPFEEWKKEKGK